jgi:uncharacterized protein GlcG (DUF336 family)
VSMSIDIARRIMEACKQRARELRSPVSIAIVDSGGHLVLFERMMSPYGWATGNISIAKASTAVMFNQSTDAVAQWGAAIPGFASSMASMTEGKFIMAAGGWPIRMGGATIGGIGVSGGNAPGRDDEIARAGLGALEAMSPPVPASPPPTFHVPQPQLQSQPRIQPSMQPTPAYPPVPQPASASQPAFAPPSPPANAGTPQNVPASASSPNNTPGTPNNVPATHHLAPEQDDPYNDDITSFDVFKEQNSSGGQS